LLRVVAADNKVEIAVKVAVVAVLVVYCRQAPIHWLAELHTQ
jgi:hypothetical protein